MRPSTHLEDAARWAVSFTLRDAPDDVVELATLQVVNVIAAVHAGASSEAGLKVWNAHRPTLGSGPCTVVPHGVSASILDALYLNAVFANALEVDDFIYRGHVSPAVLVPLAISEIQPVDGQAILRAIIIGNELAGRLGVAVTAELRHGHQRSYLLRLAAAASAGALLNLDERQLVAAYAIALTQPEVPLHRGEFSPDTKILSAASCVVEGTRAAYMAAAGVGAAGDILEHPAGFYRQLTMHGTVASPFVQLGEAWCTHALSFKRYAACGYAAGAVDAACEIHRNPAFDREAIEHVEVATGLPAIVLERLAEPHEPGVLTPVNVQFSTIRSTAAALWLGDIRGRNYAPETVGQVYEGVGRLESRTRLVHEWTYTIHSIRGLDGGLNHDATQQSLDLLQFHRTLREFRRMFGSARSVGPRDIVRLFALPASDRRFYFEHWGRNIRSYVSRKKPSSASAAGPFGDLRRLSFCPAARVTVQMRGGRRISAERIIPTGFAGDPHRATMVRDKLLVETAAVLSREESSRLLSAITNLRTSPSAAGLLPGACGHRGRSVAAIVQGAAS